MANDHVRPTPHTPSAYQTASNNLYYHPLPGIRRCWCGRDFLPTIMRTSPSHVHQPCIGIITVEASACPRRAILSLESIINTRHGRRLAAIHLWVARWNLFGALIKNNNHCLWTFSCPRARAICSRFSMLLDTLQFARKYEDNWRGYVAVALLLRSLWKGASREGDRMIYDFLSDNLVWRAKTQQ
jgi:hypothetical protein